VIAAEKEASIAAEKEASTAAEEEARIAAEKEAEKEAATAAEDEASAAAEAAAAEEAALLTAQREAEELASEEASAEARRVAEAAETAAAAEATEAAAAAATGSGCVGWRQTGGCSPFGPREAEYDVDCGATVDSGASGYCECANGRRYAEADCDHAIFTCEKMCKAAAGPGLCIAWRQTGGCSPNGDREPRADTDCLAFVAAGASGYCECAGGRAAESDCGRSRPIACAVACAARYV